MEERVKRNWNWPLWAGFLVTLAGFFSYSIFVLFPITRDFPWANLLLFGAGAVLLALGLFRAFRKPNVYRGKIVGPILSLLSLLVFSLFCYALFYIVRQMPPATGAPRVGQRAPGFSLPDQNGKPVALADLLSSGAKGVVLIFYRGHW